MVSETQSSGDVPDAPTLPDDVMMQLRSAAGSLAQHLNVDVGKAERVIFDLAADLTRDATVVQYAAVLASRRARHRLREANDGS